MEKITINEAETLYEIESIKPHLPNVLQIVFADVIPAEYGDITIYTDGGVKCSTLTGYNTVYRDEGQTVYLSNDGSEYVEPEDGGLPSEPYNPTLEELQTIKLSAISVVCNAMITAGCDVILTDGTVEHYSLSETDQINLSAAVAAVQAGAAGYPYHADGQLCRLYPAADILLIGTAATQHKLYHTTYCNHLNTWIRRVEDAEELEAINYGAELPDDLAENMAAILAAVSGGADETET
ncbi:MAG: acyl carrier protein [Lachnospiraceae bacterium]